jgi:excisionase family DNA binding protein
MSTTAPAPRIALTPAEAAQALGVSEHYLREHISHELAWIRRGRKRLVSVSELERWMRASEERITA